MGHYLSEMEGPDERPILTVTDRTDAPACCFAERMRERGRWLKALDDSSLPHTYRRLLVGLALGRCDNCGGDPARCDCDES